MVSEAIVLPTFLEVLRLIRRTNRLAICYGTRTALYACLFATRDDDHEGRLWASIEELKRRGTSMEAKKADYRFVVAHQSQKLVPERPNGSVTPMSDVYVYPVSLLRSRLRDPEEG